MEIKVLRRYKRVATPTHSRVFQPFSSSSIKCVFIGPIFQWNGRILLSTEWPMYITMAFMPQYTNGVPLQQRFTSMARKHSVKMSVAVAVVTRTKDKDLWSVWVVVIILQVN